MTTMNWVAYCYPLAVRREVSDSRLHLHLSSPRVGELLGGVQANIAGVN